ncbi:MAG: ABC transporter permease [Sandaracinaceae bacterium]
MIVLSTFALAVRELRRHLTRSVLTTLGIVIGVGAVIAMVTLGQGATARVTGDIASLGDNLVIVAPGSDEHRRGPLSTIRLFDERDGEAMREVPEVAAVSALTATRAVVVLGPYHRTTTVHGTDRDFFRVRQWELALGRPFDPAEERSAATVCVLGQTVRQDLFGAQNPLGATIRVGTLPCEVIGVLREKGRSTFGDDQDDLVLLPVLTFQRRIAGNDDIGVFFASATTSAATQRVEERLRLLMRQRRGIRPGEEDDFSVRDMREIVNIVETATGVMTALLGAIAAISLLVGGIGIMNIMLVSVTERTREIGIRLAVGARSRDVLLQFLVEAIVLSAFGGLLGIALGFGASYVAAHYLEIPFTPLPELAALAFLFSGGVGVTFGFFPARKAALMDPIDALRRE